MRSAGSPLRFLALLLGGWVCARAAMLMPPLWETPAAPGQIREAASSVRQPAVQAFYGVPTPPVAPVRIGAALPGAAHIAVTVPPPAPVRGELRGTSAAGALLDSPTAREAPRPAGPNIPALIVPPAGDRAGRRAGRWSGTAWLLWRPEASGGGGALLPLLGGSQLGARIDYRLAEGAAGQLSLYGRASRALAGASSEEAALGVAWRPPTLPLSLLVERRQRLGAGGRSGFAILAAAGLDRREIAPRVEVEGYAQAGVVGVPGLDAFADGRASMGYRLTARGAHPAITLGGMVAGSAQPGVQRLDIGPEIGVRLPLGQGGVRVSGEWRVRVAGNARPASGPAVTLITNF